MEGYTLAEKIDILKDLHIWSKMSKVEKTTFRKAQDENYADRLMRSYRGKYLN